MNQYGPQFGQPQAPAPQYAPQQAPPQYAPQQPVNPYAAPAAPAAFPGYGQPQQAPPQFNMGAPAQGPRQPMNEAQKAMLFAAAGGGATQRIKGSYLKPGHYWMMIEKTKAGMSTKKMGIGYVAIEMSVVRRLAGDDHTSNTVGEQASHIIESGTFYFAGNVNNFVGAVLGIPAEQVKQEDAQQLFDENRNPLRGTIVEVMGRLTMTRRNTPFTQVTYVREVKAGEALQHLPQQVKDRFFPNQFLERKAAQEGGGASVPVAQTPAAVYPPNFQPPAPAPAPTYAPPPVAPAPAPVAPPAAVPGGWQQPQRQPVWNPQTGSWQ